jgi:predicted RNA-binding Zn-ribbon protein involved in translation (DUF1610 family)
MNTNNSDNQFGFNPNMPVKPTRGLPLEIRPEFFKAVFGDDDIINDLTDTQQQVLRLYYGLQGQPATTTKAIQQSLGVKNHSYVRGICTQAEAALDLKKQRLVLDTLGVDPEEKDVPLQVRKQYISLMFGNDINFDGIDRNDALLFASYWGIGIKSIPIDADTLRKRFKLTHKQIKLKLKAVERQVAKNYRAIIAERLLQEWSAEQGRFCPRCGSTNINRSGSDNNGVEIFCRECGYAGGEIVLIEKLVVRLAG